MRLLFVWIIFLIACNNNSSTNSYGEIDATVNDTMSKNVATTSIDGCYEMVMNKDTAFMELSLTGNKITGNLVYKLFEKDKNEGILNGEIKDSHIYADYTFQSEGTTSVREVIFKIFGNSLIPAYGELEEDNGRIIFSDHTRLQYLQHNPFIKIDCNK